MDHSEELWQCGAARLVDHSEELWKLWDAEHRQYNMVRPTFVQWFDEVALPQDTRSADAETPGGMINSLFTTFINNWWPHRHKPNVLVLHYMTQGVSR